MVVFLPLSFKAYQQGVAKFQSAQLDVVHLDEEPSEDLYNETLQRIMSTDKDNIAIMMITMTPTLGLTPFISNFLEFSYREVNYSLSEETGVTRPLFHSSIMG